MAIQPAATSVPASPDDSAVSAVKDPRAVIMGVAGLAVILIIVVVAINNFPGDVAATVKNSKGENIVAIGSAALTAISTIVTAYFGIKVANVAREESVKSGERHEATVERLTRG